MEIMEASVSEFKLQRGFSSGMRPNPNGSVGCEAKLLLWQPRVTVAILCVCWLINISEETTSLVLVPFIYRSVNGAV